MVGIVTANSASWFPLGVGILIRSKMSCPQCQLSPPKLSWIFFCIGNVHGVRMVVTGDMQPPSPRTVTPVDRPDRYSRGSSKKMVCCFLITAAWFPLDFTCKRVPLLQTHCATSMVTVASRGCERRTTATAAPLFIGISAWGDVMAANTTRVVNYHHTPAHGVSLRAEPAPRRRPQAHAAPSLSELTPATPAGPDGGCCAESPATQPHERCRVDRRCPCTRVTSTARGHAQHIRNTQK